MKILKISFVTISFLALYSFTYSQNNYSNDELIQKIDSISKVKNVVKAKVKTLFVTNSFDKTDTDKKSITDVENFYFDGPFLVIENKYFNLNKLIYFYIEKNHFVFFFQAY